MNAVKRCLALIAATLVVGACGGDPTVDDAGTNLTIRATPGAVWMRNNTSATVNIEAVDKLGGPTAGSWTAGTVVGPMTVALDSAYQNTSVGSLGLKSRFVITPTAEGEGFIVFQGTGGTDTVPVRIAPDTGAFAVVFSDSSSALFQTITATAPAGIVFTDATTIRFFSGPLSRDTANGGLSFPAILGRSADSTQVTFVTGPGASGTARFTGLASRSTPSLQTTARAEFAMTSATPSVDTTAFTVTPTFATTGDRTTATVFDTLVVTAPAGYVFLPNTGIEFWRTVSSNRTVSNGTAAPVLISISADSSVMRWAVAPGARGRLQVNKVAFRVAPAIRFNVNGPAAETFDLRSGASGPDTSNMAFTFDKASPVAEGDTVTATAPAGMVFLPGTASIHASSAGTLSGGDSTRITGFSADSTQVSFILPPGASGEFRYSNLARRDIPQISWSARSAATISAAAAPAVVATLNPTTANANDTVTVDLDPAGPYRFRPTSTAEFGGVSAASAVVSADSLRLSVLPTPGTTGPLTLTNIRYGALPTFQVKANTAASLTTNAATDLGDDNALDDATNPVYARTVTLAAKSSIGFWDAVTFEAPDWLGFDVQTALGQQDYKFTFTNAGTYTIQVDWAGGDASTDIDIAMVDGDIAAVEGSSLTGAKPESFNVTVTAGSVHFLDLGFYDGTPPSAIKVTIRRN